MNLAIVLAIQVVLGPSDVKLVEPFGVAFDRAGNWYVVEHKGERIVRVSLRHKVEVIAGTGEAGRSGDGGDARNAQMFDPHGIAITHDGRMYVADTRNQQVRLIELKTGVITNVAGTGEEGFSGDGGPAVKATFRGAFSIALSPDDRQLYIADLGNKRVRKVDLGTGIVTTAARDLVDPRAVAVDSKGLVYILERNGNALKVMDHAGNIQTLIAPGDITPDLKGPKHLCIDRDDSVIIADAENNLIRRYDPKSGKTTTIAGTGENGSSIDPNDPLKTQLARPHGVYVHPNGDLYISDSYNNRILRMTR